MRAVIIAAAALSLAGCGAYTQAGKEPTRLGYSYDARTGVCFAYTDSTVESIWRVRSITAVPCTDKVLALVTP